MILYIVVSPIKWGGRWYITSRLCWMKRTGLGTPEVCTCFSAVASRIPSSGSLRNRGHADLFSSAKIWIRPWGWSHGSTFVLHGSVQDVNYRQYLQCLLYQRCDCWQFYSLVFTVPTPLKAIQYPFWFISQALLVKLVKPRNSMQFLPLSPNHSWLAHPTYTEKTWLKWVCLKVRYP